MNEIEDFDDDDNEEDFDHIIKEYNKTVVTTMQD